MTTHSIAALAVAAPSGPEVDPRRCDPAGREFVAFWMVEDRVVAGMNDPDVPLHAVASPVRGGVP